MELMGLHIPGASFVAPNCELRDQLTKEAVKQVLEWSKQHNFERSLANLVDERSIVNALVGLMATGGSTNGNSFNCYCRRCRNQVNLRRYF